MIITVFNICGIAGNDRVNDYIPRIEALLAQTAVEQRLVVSSCRTPGAQMDRLKKHFGKRVSWWETQQTYTVNITFNRACEMTAREFGKPEGYFFVDSGCFCPDKELMAKLASPEPEYAIRSAMANTDMGFKWWFPGENERTFFKNGNIFKIPVGKGVNLHVMWFDPRLVELFGHVMPDIFARFCTESTFSFLAAALGGFIGLYKDCQVEHWVGMDGASSGFAEVTPYPFHLVNQAQRGIKEMIADPEALASGFGYEECQKILMHDPAAYHDTGLCKDPARLAKFIRENIYLAKDRFDYDGIVEQFTP